MQNAPYGPSGWRRVQVGSWTRSGRRGICITSEQVRPGTPILRYLVLANGTSVRAARDA